MFKRFGDPFVAHDLNQRVVVSWEQSTIKFFDQCSVGYFLSKDNVCAFQPRLFKTSHLKLFSFVLIVLYLLYVILNC